MIRFKNKLQLLKKVIRKWVAEYKSIHSNSIRDVKNKLSDIDKLLDKGGVTDDVLLSRMEAMTQLQELNSSDNCDFVQKAKVRWAIEGDENSKFFHGIINRKRANLSVKGVMSEGEWVDDPIWVKDEFRNHFADRFNDPGTRHGNFSFHNRLTLEQVSDLEASVSDEEIRKAVRGCGENKSPRPDGFTFEFFRNDIDKLLDKGGVTDDVLLSRMEAMKHLQELNSSDNCDFVQKAKVRWAIEGDENSKFFHGIINRKRANLSVKGVMSEGEWVDDPIWVKDEFRNHFADRFNDPGTRHGRINFSFPNRLTLEQVFDLEASVSDEEIRKSVWGCGENKSPRPDGFTFEFFRKFWTVVGPDFCIDVKWFFEHGFFATGCNSSFVTLIPKTLDPKLIQGGLNSGKASVLVNGSPTSEFQFHRGLKQGDPLAPFLFILIMESLHLSFNRAVEAGIFTSLQIDDALTISHLFYADDAIFIGEWSKENLKGGRLTLFKSVLGSTLIYNMSIFKVPKTVLNKMENLHRNFFNGIQEGDRKIMWVKWHTVLASKKFGGLGVSSFFALNRDLSTAYPSSWNSIIKEFNYLKVQGVMFSPIARLGLVMGCTLGFGRIFGSVIALYQSPLVSSFRRNVRGGIEEQQLEHLVALLVSVILSNSNDRWVSDLNGDGVFRVKDVRNLLDEFFLPRTDVPTRWVKNIPIKVNIFAWRLALDRFPARANLVQRNVVTESQSCPLCDTILEDTSHLFFNCSLARDSHTARKALQIVSDIINYRSRVVVGVGRWNETRIKVDLIRKRSNVPTDIPEITMTIHSRETRDY
nr:RNA-directed DNA polymerase, eukaryota [Tanacetum cinerariifolium]